MASKLDVQALLFDVFGTVVDWRGSIAREVDALALGVDGAAFADAWRAKYQPAIIARYPRRRMLPGDEFYSEAAENMFERCLDRYRRSGA